MCRHNNDFSYWFDGFLYPRNTSENLFDLSLCTYTTKSKSNRKKNVLVLSTMSPRLAVTHVDGKLKPAIIKLDDFTKEGTDIEDQKISKYSCKQYQTGGYVKFLLHIGYHPLFTFILSKLEFGFYKLKTLSQINITE